MNEKQKVAVEKMCDRFMHAAKTYKRFRPAFEGYSRDYQLKRLEATMRGSVLKQRKDILEYAIKYVRANW